MLLIVLMLLSLSDCGTVNITSQSSDVISAPNNITLSVSLDTVATSITLQLLNNATYSQTLVVRMGTSTASMITLPTANYSVSQPTLTINSLGFSLTFFINIDTIVNPPYSTSVKFVAATNAQQLTFSESIDIVNLGTLTSCALEFGQKTNSAGQLTVKIQSKNGFKQGTNKITVSFRTNWTGLSSTQYGLSSNNSLLTLTSTSAMLLKNGTGATTATVNGGLSQLEIIFTQSADVDVATLLSVQIGSTNSPPTETVSSINQNIFIKTAVLVGATYFEVDEGFSCPVTTAGPNTLPSCSLSSTGAQVSQNWTFRGTLGTFNPNEIQRTDTIQIVFPTTTSLSNSSAMVFFINTTNDIVRWRTVTNQVGQNLYMNNAAITVSSTSPNFISSTASFNMELQNALVLLPNSIQPITFSIFFLRSSVKFMECKATLSTIQPNLISYITASNQSAVFYGQTSTYNIEFTPVNKISATGGFIIRLTEFILSSTTACTLNGVVTSCLIDTTSNTVSINITQQISAASTVSVLLTDIVNPTKAVNMNISVTTYNNATLGLSSTINKGNSSVNIVFSSRNLQNYAIAPDSTCLGKTFESCLYSITYTNSIQLQAGTIISLTIPSQFSFNNTLQSLTYGTTSIIGISSGKTINFSMTSGCSAATQFNISIRLINPALTNPTGFFQIEHRLNNFLLETCSNILFVLNVVTPQRFINLAVVNVDGAKTGTPGHFQLLFQASADIVTNYVFSVDLQTDFDWSTAACSQNCALTKTVSSLILTVTTNITASTQSSLTLSNVMFPRSLKTSTFSVTLCSDSTCSRKMHTMTTTYTGILDNTLTAAYSDTTNNFYGSTGPIKLQVTINVPFQAGDYLEVSLPQTVYTAVGPATFSDANFTYSTTNNIVKATITNDLLSKSVGYMTITGWSVLFQNLLSGSISITHKDIDNNICSRQSNTLSFATHCPSPCRTCNINSRSQCLSCYNSSLPTTQFYLNGTTCTNNCSSTLEYYASSLDICQACLSPCLTCLNLTACLSCTNPSEFRDENMTCVVDCSRVGYYNITSVVLLNNGSNINQKLCLPCSSACSVCQNNSATCLECSDPTLVRTSAYRCEATCPSGFYNNSRICTACSSNCVSCDASNCLQCASGYSLDASRACVSSCGNLVPYNGFCTCDSTCLTCVNTISTCTSCASDRVLKATQCVLKVDCNNGYYINGSNCVVCPALCSSCVNSTVCTACLTNKYLYNDGCYTNCRNLGSGFVNNANTCTKCTTGCNTCNPNDETECYTCIGGYTFNNGTCECVNCGTVIGSCPTGYILVDGRCVVDGGASSGKAAIIVYSLMAGAWLGFSVISKLLTKVAFLPYSVMSMFGPLEVSSYMAVMGFSKQVSRRLLATLVETGSNCLIAAIALNYVLNAAFLFIYCRYISQDPDFQANKKKQKDKVLNGILLVLGCLSNYRLYLLVFSSLCNSTLFKTRLTNVTKLVPIDILNFINILVSLIALAGFSLVLTESGSSQNQYYVAVAGIIITVIGVLGTLTSLIKDQNFFEGHEKYRGTASIENTEGVCEEGEQHHQFSNIPKKPQGNMKIANQAMSGQDQGDEPIQKKSSYIDPLKPILIGQKSMLALEDSLVEEQASSQQLYIEDPSVNKGVSSGQKPLRKRISKRVLDESINQSSILKVHDRTHDEQEKVETIINDLQSNVDSDNLIGKTDDGKNFRNGMSNEESEEERRLQQRQSSKKLQMNIDMKMESMDNFREDPRKEARNDSRQPSNMSNKKERSDSKMEGREDPRQSAREDSRQLSPSQRKSVSVSKLVQVRPRITQEPSENLSESNNEVKNNTFDLKFIEKFYQQGQLDYSQPDFQYEQISPSQFNFQNQRFDQSIFKLDQSAIHQDKARSTPLKNFNLDDLKKNLQ